MNPKKKSLLALYKLEQVARGNACSRHAVIPSSQPPARGKPTRSPRSDRHRTSPSFHAEESVNRPPTPSDRINLHTIKLKAPHTRSQILSSPTMASFRLTALIKPASAFTKPRSFPSLYASIAHYSADSPPASGAGKYPGLEPTKPTEKPRLVVLGTGWAGSRLMKDIDTKIYDVVCVSPRNHMVFTPLLASTCVGTLEFRSVAEPIGRIQPSFSTDPGSFFFLANCKGLDPRDHVLHCETLTEGAKGLKPWKFKISYDKLVIASGAQASTFGIHGVEEHAIFLREVHHAQEIRRKLLLNLMLSDVPGISEEEKCRLLHCVVVGGGPTGVEFSGELSDFIMNDVRKRYAHVKDYIHVTLIEANEILSSFDDRLRRYATTQLIKSGVRLVHGMVKDVQPEKIILTDGSEVPYGLLVWSTGVGPSPLVKAIDLPKSPGGRIGVDEWLRVPSVADVFAIGDCCGFLESTGKPVLPALAQVAERQGKYLARLLNKIGTAGCARANSAKDLELGDHFVYRHLGSMATLGRYKALVDLRQGKDAKGLSMAGFVSWFIWRSAYLTRVISWRNRFYVAINWLTTLIFGRDISRI